MEQKKLKKEYFDRNLTRIQNLYVLDLFRNLLHPGFTPISPSGSFSTSVLLPYGNHKVLVFPEIHLLLLSPDPYTYSG